jgi:hypothetical protein
LKVPRGSIPRMMADNFGNKVRHSGKIQWSFRYYSVNIQETFREGTTRADSAQDYGYFRKDP